MSIVISNSIKIKNIISTIISCTLIISTIFISNIALYLCMLSRAVLYNCYGAYGTKALQGLILSLKNLRTSLAFFVYYNKYIQ